MSAEILNKLLVPALYLVALLTFVCLGLAFWMAIDPARTASMAGNLMFQDLNFGWRCGFATIAGLLSLRFIAWAVSQFSGRCGPAPPGL